MNAYAIISAAAKLVHGDRAKTHGNKALNHKNIAVLWSAYTEHMINAHDVAIMMVLLKVARTKTGELNADDYIDIVGYAGIAGELAGVPDPALPEEDPLDAFEKAWTGGEIFRAHDHGGKGIVIREKKTGDIVFRSE